MTRTPTALVIGGTRFIGRHTVTEFREAGYEVYMLNRGNHENPFADADDVTHVRGDRTDRDALRDARDAADPDVVVDCVAYYPADVEAAVEVFADVDGYVYISSGSAYGREEIPKREGETPLCPCSDEQATDGSAETYGNRKAEGDRIVFEAANRGVNAMSVRPCIVYGPYDYTERLDFWLDRVATHDRVLLPGDGDNVWHRAYVEDVARALRLVAERGEPGEAYNVGDRRLVTLREMVELIADVMDREIEIVAADGRELAAGDLEPDDYVLYREYPHVLDTCKLAALGWESTPLREAMERTVEEHLESDRDGSEHDPGRDAEERVLGVLETM
ncbi:NAD-dependent epimerase/dehydratase family protein [Halalkaliarchaeum sp. AArc-GB]|uniref:NAD-dependent epimerase/dehydratase family protein n=1 Tax=Halalkaliarchaeum sp. AArc-GB TaxID=3074078 RepID=UPI0028650662|nr:NAD-dependent epimerase/dehydratase family protein [Halalkaliarchaeum sp. AArc-GB]MDR5673413.1 NAD-dependent epimerase/dehydratase family protein [Halalkaliarchaeum sp. AArc-GB]